MKTRDSRKQTSTMKQFAGGAALALLLGMPSSAQPAQAEPANSPAQIDRQERQPEVRTYEKFPDPDGDDQAIDLKTYEKNPDPDGDSQSTDYVRYPEENEANNGQNPPVDLTVIDEGDE
jgi:hypothetical protein